MKYCKKTTIPESAVNVTFDDNGVSSVYNSNITFLKLKNSFWKLRENKFKEIIKNNKKKK